MYFFGFFWRENERMQKKGFGFFRVSDCNLILRYGFEREYEYGDGDNKKKKN